jgi:hypothetical protein
MSDNSLEQCLGFSCIAIVERELANFDQKVIDSFITLSFLDMLNEVNV